MRTLSEKSLNETLNNKSSSQTNRVPDATTAKEMITMDSDGTETDELYLPLTIEILDKLAKEKVKYKDYVDKNLNESRYLEIWGWSRRRSVPETVYENLLTSDLIIKRLILRGRGDWCKCYCPKETNSMGKQIDTISAEKITNLEHLYIMRTFRISACALLDLIARSPKLKVLRFYGTLTECDHHEAFQSVRFLSELEAVYWPWCKRKEHLPLLKTLVKRHEAITTFYSNGDTTCDLLAADCLQKLRHLSLILNESWDCKGNTKKATRHLKKIYYLANAKSLESLEIRSFDIDLNTDEDNDESSKSINDNVLKLFEQYQLQLWEQIGKFSNLKYLAIYGAWNLDFVCQTMAKRGIKVEYLKTNLMPSALAAAVDNCDSEIILSIDEGIKQLRTLANLRSIHYMCHDNLTGVDKRTVSILKELSDLIWHLDIRTRFTDEVEDLLTTMLKRANQTGKSYSIRLLIEMSDEKFTNLFVESQVRYSATTSLRSKLEEIVERTIKENYNTRHYKAFHLWGIKQVGSSRDRTMFEQLKTSWQLYEDIYDPVDMYR